MEIRIWHFGVFIAWFSQPNWGTNDSVVCGSYCSVYRTANKPLYLGRLTVVFSWPTRRALGK